MSCGPHNIDGIVAETLKICRTGEIKHQQYNGRSDKPVNEYTYKVNAIEMEEFFRLLVSEIRIQDWDDDYSVAVFDGNLWECKIGHSDNTIKRVRGTVEPSPKGEQFKRLILKLTDFVVEPWTLLGEGIGQ